MKKAVLKHLTIFIAKLQSCHLTEKETPTQMFSSEYCKIFKNTYFEEHLLMVACDFFKQLQNSSEELLLY